MANSIYFLEHSLSLHPGLHGSQPPTPTSPYMYPGLSPVPGMSPVFGTAFSFSPTHSDMSTPPSTPPHSFKAKKGVFTYGMFALLKWCLVNCFPCSTSKSEKN